MAGCNDATSSDSLGDAMPPRCTRLSASTVARPRNRLNLQREVAHFRRPLRVYGGTQLQIREPWAPVKTGESDGYSGVRELILENRHTGERLALRRMKRGDEVWLEVKGSLPPHRQGPPLHIHVAEDEEGFARTGTVSAVLNGRRISACSGERVSFPRGSAHRWWNDGNEPLVLEGYVQPVVDFDRFLQALFEVVNAGPDGRPPLFYMGRESTDAPGRGGGFRPFG